MMEPDVDSGPWVVTEVDPAGMDIKRKKGRGAPIPHRVSLSNGREQLVLTSGLLRTAWTRMSPTLSRRNFGVCPICLDPDPGTREDVPPISMGGDVLTYTCKRCNNTLGSRIDNHLVTWWNGELFDVKVHAPGVTGQRSLGLTALRWMGDDYVLMPRQGRPPAFDECSIEEEEVTALPESVRAPDPVRVQLAALKSAYLAACVALGQVPSSPSAKGIQRGLRHVRDTDELPTTGFGFPVVRCPGGQKRQPSQLVVIGRETWISLAGVLLTPWPLCDAPPPWRGGSIPTQPVDDDRS